MNRADKKYDLDRPLLDNMLDFGLIKHNLYGFYFSKDYHRPGAMTIGKIDYSKVAPGETFRWVNTTSQHRWNIDILDIKGGRNGGGFGLCGDQGCTGLVVLVQESLPTISFGVEVQFQNSRLLCFLG